MADVDGCIDADYGEEGVVSPQNEFAVASSPGDGQKGRRKEVETKRESAKVALRTSRQSFTNYIIEAK
jgi:hypothetical protein